jgi:hypothetical protein
MAGLRGPRQSTSGVRSGGMAMRLTEGTSAPLGVRQHLHSRSHCHFRSLEQARSRCSSPYRPMPNLILWISDETASPRRLSCADRSSPGALVSPGHCLSQAN